MNRRVRPARAFARTKTWNGPYRLDAGFRGSNFGDWPFPLRPDFVAIVALAVNACLREFRGRHRGVFRKLTLGGEQRIQFVVDFLLASGVEKFFAY